MEAVKPLQDGTGFAVRLYETDGQQTECTVKLLDQTAALTFGPHEIKTVCFPDQGQPVETNLLEDYR